jgi:hypothetical protein
MGWGQPTSRCQPRRAVSACNCKNKGTRSTAPSNKLAEKARVGMTGWERSSRRDRSRTRSAKTLVT